jgi:2-dehydro-3-deoxygalactonokinase
MAAEPSVPFEAGPAAKIDWIAVDWGTTNMRAWAMVDDRPVASTTLAKGMAGLTRDDYEAALLEAIGHWLPNGCVIDVVACGMVGSRQGWVEAGYEAVPSPPHRAVPMARAPSRDPRIAVHVIHGLKQAAPADVMRGEETQLAGLVAAKPGFVGVACLPGTHAKWVTIEQGIVKRFATFMTGELFALLAGQSVLRHTVSDAGWNDEAFADAVAEALASPVAAFEGLFGIRAGALLDQVEPTAARARLSGLLIGAEIAAARPLWQSSSIVLIGAEATSRHYARALAVAGASADLLDVAAMTLDGLVAAHRQLQLSRAHP